MQTTKERLIEFLKIKQLSQAKFANEIGLSISYVNSMTDNPTQETLNKIKERFPEFNLDWLLTGEGEMIKTNNQHNKVNTNNGIVGIQGDGNNITNNDISAIKELTAPIVSLMEKKDEQISEVIGILKSKNIEISEVMEILKSKDEQINRLIGLIEKYGKQAI